MSIIWVGRSEQEDFSPPVTLLFSKLLFSITSSREPLFQFSVLISRLLSLKNYIFFLEYSY